MEMRLYARDRVHRAEGIQKTMEITLGIDIGSTTIKCYLRRDSEVLLSCYERHYSRVREKTKELLERAREIIGNEPVKASISGSAGLGLAEGAGIPFVQEVFATGEIVKRMHPDASCVIELGGEDAKILFLKGGMDERMNGSCAGGTGAFIDQMASLLNVSLEEMDKMSLQSERLYPIASRCGVFAKSDIQPLINQGARKEDIAASIYQSVVNQTISGLAQGRKIDGKVLFLGGPLYFCKGLRKRFVETLHLRDGDAVFPEWGRLAVAMGASIYAQHAGVEMTCTDLLRRVSESSAAMRSGRLAPLFQNEKEYSVFMERHAKAVVPRKEIAEYAGEAYLGIDCGSTTMKLVLISEDKRILYSYYAPNKGDPVGVLLAQLKQMYALCGDRISIRGSAVTGYGEELIKNAFRVDSGIVETIAHFTAARHFCPDVDFILDIGGQDMKCFSIRDGAIDSILLNEACSSGCGSFLSAFADSMGYTVEDFAKKGLMAKAPVNLGTRCTVFMNSSVKQAQKEGASIEDISAGLSISVVKNALYKVIRVSGPDDLGKKIVVQGGTFHNDAVLRAFEQELGRDVIRPDIAGLMGAFGAALFSMKHRHSDLIRPDELDEFVYSSKAAVCNGCENHCRLTVNTFSGGRRFIMGNQCEKGLGLAKAANEELPNLYAFKRNLLTSLQPGENFRGRIGLPMALGMYELYPFWHGLFTALGFEVIPSRLSTRRTYEKGQFTIPSDTACYPAKLMHGHVIELVEDRVDAIFAPCITYNFDEHESDNHYNCPVVAYYPELLHGNVDALKKTTFLYPYLDINSDGQICKALQNCLKDRFPGITKSELKRAVRAGREAMQKHTDTVHAEGERSLQWAKENNRRVMILAGRPYHIDPEISHGIDKLANSLGFVVVSEDSICHLAAPQRVHVLNQWTYHSRLYRAARYAADHENVELVQLVSFGCGVDAITTDEVRSILEKNGKIYTQVKIDEITNLGAVKIRLRSLIGALEERDSNANK